ncbi:hypothetical protein BCR36DRAFT_404372 [Piromyces finnis]|uniref:Actin-like ATPase domain-containing protein n=1 Tax=Piromyces finnis TaxID=1754191 RepID=A0A1Y1VB31_9FUNG|nr:hypothetical protein BCR36DRAFT_404372 [Piromyces finnis]|eukprot:ORX50768.1 hypothetical protein BCR36DRAFT_404372 [Piromyces finnis]
MDPLYEKIKKSITFVAIDIGSYSTKSLSSHSPLNKTFENQIDSATRYQLYDIPSNNIYVKNYNKDEEQTNKTDSNTVISKRDEIIKYDYLNIRPKCLIDKIKLYNVNYSNTPQYYDKIENDEICTNGICIDNNSGFIGYKIKPPNQKNTYFISYNYHLQRYIDLYMNELLEKMNPQNQNKKIILIFTIPLFENDANKATKDESYKYFHNLNKKRYIDSINKGISKYKNVIAGVVYVTEIESLIQHWKNNFEYQMLSLQNYCSKPEQKSIPDYQKKVLFLDFGCYHSKFYLTQLSSNTLHRGTNKENKIDDNIILEWDILNISGEQINNDIIQLLLKKYPDIKKSYSKALGKYKIWRTVDQEIKRAFTNPNVKDFSCEILNAGDYYDLMINRAEINDILNPYYQLLINKIEELLIKYSIEQNELEVCICGDGALIFENYIMNTLNSNPIIKNNIHSVTWNKVNTLHGSLLKLHENINKFVTTIRKRRISTLSEKRSISKILYNQHSFDAIISMESNLKQILHPSQKIEFGFNSNYNTSQNKLTDKGKLKAVSDSSISEYTTDDIINFKDINDVINYLNTTI